MLAIMGRSVHACQDCDCRCCQPCYQDDGGEFLFACHWHGLYGRFPPVSDAAYMGGLVCPIELRFSRPIVGRAGSPHAPAAGHAGDELRVRHGIILVCIGWRFDLREGFIMPIELWHLFIPCRGADGGWVGRSVPTHFAVFVACCITQCFVMPHRPRHGVEGVKVIHPYAVVRLRVPALDAVLSLCIQPHPAATQIVCFFQFACLRVGSPPRLLVYVPAVIPLDAFAIDAAAMPH